MRAVLIHSIKDISILNVDDYDLLILPGGAKAMEYMRQDKDILKFISEFNDSGNVIASICLAAQLLISAKVVPKIINIPWATAPFLARGRPRVENAKKWKKAEFHANAFHFYEFL